jgi:hypothetical protein
MFTKLTNAVDRFHGVGTPPRYGAIPEYAPGPSRPSVFAAVFGAFFELARSLAVIVLCFIVIPVLLARCVFG